MEFGIQNVKPSRNCFAQTNISKINMLPVDYVKQKMFPNSFIHFVKSLPLIKNPESLKNMYDHNEININNIVHDIVNCLLLYGLNIDQEPIQIFHFFAIQKAIYKSNRDPDFIYTRDDFADECDGLDFNFVSSDISKMLNAVSKYISFPLVILYYTSDGFVRFNLPNIDFTVADFIICLNDKLCIYLNFIKFCVTHPLDKYGEKWSSRLFFQIIDFIFIEDSFYPFIHFDSLADFTWTTANFPARLDSLTFPFHSVVGKSAILHGLIGTYSQIKHHLSHPEVKVNVIDNFDSNYPFIGVYLSKTAYIYVFLYLPNNEAPSHPLFKDVTKYAISFMNKICYRTLILAEAFNKVETIKSCSKYIPIYGFQPFGESRFLGNYESSLILQEKNTFIYRSTSIRSIEFESIYHFILWRMHMSHLYNITFEIANSKNKDENLLSSHFIYQNVMKDIYDFNSLIQNPSSFQHQYLGSKKLNCNVIKIYKFLIKENGHIFVEFSIKDNKFITYIFNSLNEYTQESVSEIQYLINNHLVCLKNQLPAFSILNAFNILKYKKIIVVSKITKYLVINILPYGFNEVFLPKPNFILNIMESKKHYIQCSFSTKTNILILLLKCENNDLYLYSLKISFNSDQIQVLAEKSLKSFISNFSMNLLNQWYLTSFILSPSGTTGLISFYQSINNIKTTFIATFDPNSLNFNRDFDIMENYFIPIFISDDQTSKILIFKGKNNLEFPKIYKYSNTAYTIIETSKNEKDSIGVCIFQNYIYFLYLNERNYKNNTIQLNDFLMQNNTNLNSNNVYPFTPTIILNLSIKSIYNYGICEIDKVANGYYGLNLVTIDIGFNTDDKSLMDDFNTLCDEILSKSTIKFEIHSHNNQYMDHDLKVPGKQKNILSIGKVEISKCVFFQFFHYILGSPCFLYLKYSSLLNEIYSSVKPSEVNSLIFNPDDISLSSIIEETFIRLKSKVPPFPLIRNLIDKGDILSHTIIGIDGCCHGMELKILNEYTGIQISIGKKFSSPKGSIRLGSKIVPTQFDRTKRITSLYLLNSISIEPLDNNSISYLALAFIHAIILNGVIVFATKNEIDFILQIFKKMKKILQLLNEIIPLRFNIFCQPFLLRLIFVCKIKETIKKDMEWFQTEIQKLMTDSGDIYSKFLTIDEFVLFSNDSNPNEIARIIPNIIHFPEENLNDSFTKIINVASLYGSIIENIHLLEI